MSGLTVSVLSHWVRTEEPMYPSVSKAHFLVIFTVKENDSQQSRKKKQREIRRTQVEWKSNLPCWWYSHMHLSFSIIHLQKQNSINWKCIWGIILQIQISFSVVKCWRKILPLNHGEMEYQHINMEYAISAPSNIRVALCLFYEDTIRMLRGLWALSNCDQFADCLTIQDSEDILLGDKTVSSVKTMIIFIYACHPVN